MPLFTRFASERAIPATDLRTACSCCSLTSRRKQVTLFGINHV